MALHDANLHYDLVVLELQDVLDSRITMEGFAKVNHPCFFLSPPCTNVDYQSPIHVNSLAATS
jgi:hypothetical protein